jgi:phosphate transport system protein
MQTLGHADRNIDKELAALIANLSQMGEKILAQLSIVEEAIRGAKPEQIEQAKKLDKAINALEMQIEEEVMLFFSRHQPLLIELRFVTFSIKLVLILERMGDLAKNTVRRLNKLGENIRPEIANELQEMTLANKDQLKRSLQMLSSFNAEMTKALTKRDDTIDAHYKKVKKLLNAELDQFPTRARALNQLKQIATNLERSGDFTTDITRILYFIHTGDRLSK